MLVCDVQMHFFLRHVISGISFLLTVPCVAYDAWSEEVRGHFVEPHSPIHVHEVAGKAGKASMVIVMTTWCGACAGLRKSVNAGSKVRPLLDRFVVAYAEDDDKKHDWTVPGQDYVPQVYFFTADGKRLPIYAGSEQYKYFFSDENTLADAMTRALDLIAKGDTQDQHHSGNFDPVHGFDKSIVDMFLDNLKPQEIQQKALEANKPFLVLISQPWCEACLKLVQAVNSGKETKELLGAFVVTIAHGEDGQAAWQQPGQNYVPQAYFYDIDGSPLLVNGPHADRGYPHFFSNDTELASAMAAALDQSKGAGEL